jgi:hypothetical protein
MLEKPLPRPPPMAWGGMPISGNPQGRDFSQSPDAT